MAKLFETHACRLHHSQSLKAEEHKHPIEAGHAGACKNETINLIDDRYIKCSFTRWVHIRHNDFNRQLQSSIVEIKRQRNDGKYQNGPDVNDQQWFRYDENNFVPIVKWLQIRSGGATMLLIQRFHIWLKRFGVIDDCRVFWQSLLNETNREKPDEWWPLVQLYVQITASHL